MKPSEKKYIKIRIFLVGLMFSIFLALIGTKAVYLQVFCGSWLSERASNQYERSFACRGKRGSIYDSNQREVAVSIDVTSIAAYPKNVKDVPSTAKSLAKSLKIDPGQLTKKLTAKRSFVWIKRHVTPNEAKEVRVLKLPGIDFFPEHKRFYPMKTLFAQVVGFSGMDGRGLEGIEFYYDSYLKGADYQLTVLKDALGRGFGVEKSWDADYSGNNLVLTIDRAIQYIAEKSLEKAVLEYSAKSGMVVVMSPKKGAVLALAHFPFFNPNSLKDFRPEVWRNRSITDPFEPGSTMKIFLAAAALESGGCTPNTIFFCENGAYRIGRNTVHDTHSHGWLSLQQIVKYSSNIGAVKVTEKIGPEVLYETLHDFGFGLKTGIDCPGETTGSVSHYRRWSKIDTGAIAFGQGVSVSAIQLITAACAIANDGILMKPYIVQAISDPNGRLIKSFAPCKVRRVVSEQTAKTVRRIMTTVISSGGTGEKAALEGYSVCGKTGTAQKTDPNGGYARGKYVASFIGFAPEDHPELAILVLIDEPRKNHFGGIVAAPAFREIAHETLHYMNINPRQGGERLTVSRGVKARG